MDDFLEYIINPWPLKGDDGLKGEGYLIGSIGGVWWRENYAWTRIYRIFMMDRILFK